jgi:hypothetical protein
MSGLSEEQTAMNNSLKPLPPDAEFAAQVERLVAPMFAECFTDETRRVRNLLLTSSFALLLLVLGIVQVDQNQQVPLLGIKITVTKGLRWVLAALSAYFLASLLARSYIEWKLWRLKHQSSLLELRNLGASLAVQYITSSEPASREARERAAAADKFLNAKLYYLLDTQNPSRRTLRIRFIFEMVFPILLGAIAIVAGLAV